MNTITEKTNLGARDAAVHLHSYTNLATVREAEPLVIVRGDGVNVIDDQGRSYLEAMSGLWCCSLGFSNPDLARVGAEALHELPCYHTFNQRTHPAVIELAERLLAIAPTPMARVFFANSGSEANDSAAKMVWYYHNAIGKPQKKKIISRKRAYHGVTAVAASMGGLEVNHRDFDLPLAGFLHVETPHYYRQGKPGESEADFSSRLARELEDTILAEGPETVAAFIAEPVMGAGGVVVPPVGYFDKIQPILKKYDILFIADEVICGFGRTGNSFGSITYGIKPDILTCAKALSSGYMPISAVLVNDKVHQALATNSGRIGTFAHGYTYSGHPVAAAVAVETLKIYERQHLFEHVRDLAPIFEGSLRELAARPFVGETRGIGLIGGVELVQGKASRKPWPLKQRAGVRFAALAQQEGLIVRAMGDSIGLCPPLIITEAELRDLFARLNRTMDRFDSEAQTWATVD